MKSTHATNTSITSHTSITETERSETEIQNEVSSLHSIHETIETINEIRKAYDKVALSAAVLILGGVGFGVNALTQNLKVVFLCELVTIATVIPKLIRHVETQLNNDTRASFKSLEDLYVKGNAESQTSILKAFQWNASTQQLSFRTIGQYRI